MLTVQNGYLKTRNNKWFIAYEIDLLGIANLCFLVVPSVFIWIFQKMRFIDGLLAHIFSKFSGAKDRKSNGIIQPIAELCKKEFG